MVIYAAIVLGNSSECFIQQLKEGQSVLGLKPGYDYEYVFSFFNSLDQGGLICYRNMILIWDNIFPLIYGSMYIFWISLIYRNLRIKQTVLYFLNLFPIFHIMMDWAENIAELILIFQFSEFKDLNPDTAMVSSVISVIKWSGSIITYLIITAGLIIFLIKKYFKTENSIIKKYS